MVALLFLLFGALSAFVEAVLYARRGAEAFRFNEHAAMVLQRAVVLLLAPAGIGAYHWSGSLWWVLAELPPALLLFPLVHDEAYNFTRLWLRESEKTGPATAVWGVNVSKWVIRLVPATPDGLAFSRALNQYRYGYQSPTTTARFDFNGRQRTWLALLGLAAWGFAASLLL